MCPDFIRDGKGKGYQAGVSSHNFLETTAVTWTGEHHTCHHEQLAFTLKFNVTPTAAGDRFLYIKNTGGEEICITSIYIYTASAEGIDVDVNVTGTPVGGTTLTPVNKYVGSAVTPDATVEYGNDITGLSTGECLGQYYVGAAGASSKITWGSMIIIPENKAIAISAVNGAINIIGSVSINVHSHEW